MKKPTKATLYFLRRHANVDVLRKSDAHKSYDFVGRVRDQGYIEIVDGGLRGWPWIWAGTRLTEKGKEALK